MIGATPVMENAHLTLPEQVTLYDVAFKPRFLPSYRPDAFAWRAVFG